MASLGAGETLGERFFSAPRLRRATAGQGLGHNTVNAVAQDRTGFMWLGTEKGLVRHDGLRFEQFLPIPGDPQSLSAESVTSLLVDSSGALWVGTWGGGLNLFRASEEEFSRLPSRTDDPETLRDDRISTLFEDRAGLLWVGTASGLDRLDRATRVATRIGAAVEPGSILAVGEDLYGNLWVGASAGLFRVNLHTLRLEDPGTTSPGLGVLPTGPLHALALDRLGRLWAASEAGLRVLDRERGFLAPSQLPIASSELDSVPATAMFSDPSGALWVGTRGRGLFRADLATGIVTRLHHDPATEQGLTDNDVHALFADHSGVLWIATHSGGVDRLDLKPEMFHNVTHDIRDPATVQPGRVWSFYEATDGSLWVGTDHGLDRFDPATQRFARAPVHQRVGVPEGAVTRLAKAGGRGFWAALWPHRLVLLSEDGRVEKHITITTSSTAGRESDGILALLALPDGGLLVGTGRGLWQLDPASGHPYPSRLLPDPVSDLPVTALLLDTRQRIWVGTNGGGVTRCSQSDCQRLTGDDESSSASGTARVWSLHEDAAGRIWVGTASGLGMVDPATDSLAYFRIRPGFPNDSVYGILSDNLGSLWLANDLGLTRFDPARETFRTYLPDDGLQASLATPGACLASRDGTLLFGGRSGFNAFTPSTVRDNPNVPRVVMRSFSSPDREMRFASPMHEIDEIRLTHTENFFSIGFAALDYTDPARNAYRYQLRGFDLDWVSAGERRLATYTNVPPGRYLFHVIGSNNNSVWNEVGATLPIIIAPPPWRTWWFQAIAGLSLAGALTLAHRLRVRQLERQRIALEHEVAARTRDLATSRDLLAEHRDELVRINEIVKAINSPHEFTELLSSLLAQLKLIRGVDKAAALIWIQESQVFRFQAAMGWPLAELQHVEMTAQEVRARYEQDAEEIYPDIFVARSHDPHPDGSRQSQHQWPSMLIMRIRLDDRVAGYLILDSVREQEGFAERDILLLDSLREHILSAFIKAHTMAELQELNAKKNEFLGMAAHDLRGPLGLIGAWAGLVMRQIEGNRLQPERAVRDLGRVVKVAEHMNRMVSDLLDISAIEAGKIQLVCTPEDIQGLCEECEHLFGRLAADKGIALEIVPSPGPLVAPVDRDRIIEVLSNLLSNAIKFTPPGGSVRVWCEASDSEITTHVADTGPGLSADDLKAVFRRFGRLSARPTGGEPSTGLGLAIVRKLVELHGGSVWAEGIPGQGARFSFLLPR